MAQPAQFMGDEREVVHHVSRRKKRDPEPVSMNLNLTSMIDVIFLLLIYFVVTANFAVGEGVIMSNTPEGSGPAKPGLKMDNKLRVYLVSGAAGPRDYSITIEGTGNQPRNFKDLSETLASMQIRDGGGGSYKPDDAIIITPNGDVVWGHVVNAFNAAIAARYTNVQFGTTSGG